MKNLQQKAGPFNGSFFHELTPSDIDALLFKSARIKLAKNTVVFEQDEPGDTMYLIESGQVSLELITREGKILTLAVLGKNEFFGEMAVMDNAGRSCRAVAATDLQLAAITREDFRALLLQKPEIALKIIAILCRRLRLTDNRLEDMAYGRVRERFLNMFADPRNGDRTIKITKTHQQLAADLGTTRETITRVIKELRTEGWIILNKGRKGNSNSRLQS
ncbi:MAG: Crp/Fnr family transcriptional regulator [Firmicutes bacterium]|nr:Crp/Fnr family transcriptional regulator [Bacillota bacterium]